MTGLPAIRIEYGCEPAKRALDDSPAGAVELARAGLDDLPYRDLVAALLTRQGFRLDFNQLEPDAALTMVSDQLLGPGSFQRERALLAQDISELARFMGALTGAKPQVAIRTYFAPGDLVWHLDRLDGSASYRLVWPIGRPAGMCVTPADNIDTDLFRAYMRREHALLCRMDTRVMRSGAAVERLWAHRPAQLEAMKAGHFPFLRDPRRLQQVSPGAASIHRVETPSQAGTYHRSSWANRASPGFQLVITATAGSA